MIEMEIQKVYNFTLPEEVLLKNLTELLPKIGEYFGSPQIFSEEEERIILLSYFVLSFCGLVSNALIIFIIIKSKKLRTAANYLIINLNVSDILLCLICMPFTLIQILRRNWFLGSFICKMVPLIQGVTVFVSATTISAIALQRLSIITQNKKYASNSRIKRKVLIKTAIIWIFATIISLPVSLSHSDVEIKIAGVYLYNRCLETWPSMAKSVYSSITLIVQLLIPTALLVASQIKIKFYLKEEGISHASKLQFATADSAQQLVAQYRSQRETGERNSKAISALFRVWFTFLLSWLPWNLVNLYFDYTAENSLSSQELYRLFAICHLIAMSSAITNAILYGWLNTNVKKEILHQKKKIANFFEKTTNRKQPSSV